MWLQFHPIQQGDDEFVHFAASPVARAVHFDHIAQLILDPDHRVERIHRPLWDQCDLVPACAAHLVFAKRHQLHVAQVDGAGLDHAGRLGHTQEGRYQGGLAAARFAHQPKALTGLNLKRDAVDRLHRSTLGFVVDHQILHTEDGRGWRRRVGWLCHGWNLLESGDKVKG